MPSVDALRRLLDRSPFPVGPDDLALPGVDAGMFQCVEHPNGQRDARWGGKEKIKVTRKIDRMRIDFNIAVSEHHLASARITVSKTEAGSSSGR
jgi:hypothetical protein